MAIRIGSTLILGIVLFTQSCANNQVTKLDLLQSHNQFDIGDTVKSNLENLKKFAESFNPSGKRNEKPDTLPSVSKEIKDVISKLHNDQYSEGEKYIVLIILKLHRSHLECCNQTYELRQKYGNYTIEGITSPILQEFLRFTKNYKNNELIEFLPSSIAYNWIEKNGNIFKYELITEEFKKIKALLVMQK